MKRIRKLAVGLAFAACALAANATPVPPQLDADAIEALMNSGLSREQIAILLSKALGYDITSAPNVPSGSFNDLPPDQDFYQALSGYLGGQQFLFILAQSGIIEGGAVPFPGTGFPPSAPPSSVPEPHVYALMLAGLSAAGLVARRRKKQESRKAATTATE